MTLRSRQGRCTVNATILADGTNPLLLLDGQVLVKLDSHVLQHYDVVHASEEELEEWRRVKRRNDI